MTNAKRRSKLESAHVSPEMLVASMLLHAAEYAAVWRLPFSVRADDLLPLPPICVLTLDDLIEGDDPQRVALALLVESEGFTAENTVVISARARRRHTGISAVGIRNALGRSDSLPSRTVATLLETVKRHNVCAWSAELIEITAELGDSAMETLCAPKTSDELRGTRGNWRDLVIPRSSRVPRASAASMDTR